ncbi:hypothetical protein [Aurantimicrobium sp. INA4]|uniref:hypothetical protein n=1 Tax=Aurantimicrobium sp. INA4 TaxID=2986279 RepID=UPI002493A1EC|nr:hypothetical protein [Aurantimicrobium sp. INA4]
MKKLFALLTSVVTLAGLLLAFSPTSKAEAAVANQFNPGYIISDQNFFDGNSMSPMDVARFIDSKSGVCRAGYTCLKDYLQAVPNMRAEAGLCNGYTAHPLQSAAEIISRVAASCGVSAKVLLVLLQKEQSLITDTWPVASQYARATGFACPDTAPCDPSFGGFFYQVYNAARQMRNYGLAPERWNYRAGQINTILFHPNRDCGSSNIFIQNRATAALYNYTPYQPNAAALNNLYGTGDACSAYGNRNFWRLYTDWFGPTTAPLGTPEGDISVSANSSGIQLSGWAVDPDAPTASVAIAVQIGTVWRQVIANSAGNDLSANYPGAGPNHAVNATLPFDSGTYVVCLYLVNAGGSGGMGSTGCRSVTVPVAPAPIVTVESVTSTAGRIQVNGWAVNTDSPTTGVNIAINIGSRWIQATGGQPNSAAPGQVSGAGSNQGFTAQFDAPPGQQTFCIWANKSNGSATMVGCRTVLVAEARPAAGAIETVTVNGNSVTISGWAVWPDSPSTSVHLAANVGSSWTPISANQNNPAANTAYPGVGNSHGFTVNLTAPSGSQSICIWTTNPNSGPTILGCRTVVVGASTAGVLAAVESVTPGPGQVNFSGWAVWPSSDSTVVRVAANIGSRWYPIDANQNSTTIQQSVPGVSAQHGFSGSIPLPAGTHQVCFWAAQPNAPAKFLECRSVVVPEANATIGELNNISGGAGGIHFDGWAVMPSSPTSQVRIAINVGSQWFPTDTGVANSLAPSRVSGAGPNQGYNALMPMPPGTYEACVWAAGVTRAVVLGCSTVTVLPTPSLSSMLTEFTPVSGGIRVSGWAVWPSQPTQSVNVAANIGSSWTSIPRGLSNPLVPGFVLNAGQNQGFSGVIPAARGEQTICIWASNVSGPASNIGCRTVNVP